MDTINEGYARVSTVLSQWDRFSGIDPIVLENKKNIGIEVHTAIDFYNTMKLYPAEISEAARPYFDSYIKWAISEKFSVMKSEERYYDERLKITGAIDALVKFPDSGQLILCDWKTSYSADPINWPLQASFYQYLLSVNRINVHPMSFFVKLSKNGDFPEIFEYLHTDALMTMCEHSVATYYYQKPWLDKRKEGFRE